MYHHKIKKIKKVTNPPQKFRKGFPENFLKILIPAALILLNFIAISDIIKSHKCRIK